MALSGPRPARRIRDAAAALAGPALILAAVLVVLHGFWLGARLTNQHVDVLAFWLPRWCYLGESLAAGRIPTWLPFQFGGVPFASDPQSGWLYVPAMLLFSVFSCGRALGLFITLQPALAGLGMYWFLRNEGLGRPAASVGGLTLSLTMAGSVVVLSLPFSGALAWTALSLAGASGYLHSRTRLSLLVWLALTAFAWSQIAGAHMTNGLLMGTAVLLLYVVVRSALQVRTGQRGARAAVAMGASLLLTLPVLSAAVFIPRLALLPRTSIGHGYLELARLAARLSGTRGASPLAARGVGPWWGTSFARGPGGYVGALAVLLGPVALASRRWRLPAGAFAVAGLAGYLLNLDALVASPQLRDMALDLGVGELWLRSPARFRYPLVLAFAALAGYGMQAWIDMARAGPGAATLRRALWFLPAVLLFVALPLAAGSRMAEYVPLAAGAAYALPLLLLAARGPNWPLVALPALLAVELTAAGLAGQADSVPQATVRGSEYVSGLGHSFPKFGSPFIDAAEYMQPGPIGATLTAARNEPGRYFTFDPKVSRQLRGFLDQQGRPHWPAYQSGRSLLFGIEEIQGYSPVQVERYWRLVRRVNSVPILYNAATFQSLRPEILRLFGVRWLIVPSGLPPPSAASMAAREGRYSLYRLRDEHLRASPVFRWDTVAAAEALSRVLDRGFDPAREAVVEREPRVGGIPISPSGSAGRASYRELNPERVLVDVTTRAPGLLVVRNAFDRNWTATVDGRPAHVMVADYMMQAVPVPAGTHTVELAYRDRMVGVGLLASAVAWGLLLVLMLSFRFPGRPPLGMPALSRSARRGSGGKPR